MSHVADVRDLLTILESIEDIWYHGVVPMILKDLYWILWGPGMTNTVPRLHQGFCKCHWCSL